MGRPKVHGERVTTAFRLPIELHTRLVAAARERDLSANFLVVKALEDFIPRLVRAEDLQLTRADRVLEQRIIDRRTVGLD